MELPRTEETNVLDGSFSVQIWETVSTEFSGAIFFTSRTI